MSNPVSTYFFTVRLCDPFSDLLIREVAQLRDAMRYTRSRYPFHIDAIVVLPSVIHTLWTVPDEDTKVAHRWAMVKSRFSRGLPPARFRTVAQIKRSEKGIWQRRFWTHPITDKADLDAHRQMIHAAPVQAGMVAQPQDWLWTSLHRDIANRVLLANPVPPKGLSKMDLPVRKIRQPSTV